MSPVERAEHLFFYPLLALWEFIEKLYSHSLFNPDSIYSSNNNIS